MAVGDLLKKKEIMQSRFKVLTILITLSLFQIPTWFLSERDKGGVTTRELRIVSPVPSLPQLSRPNSHLGTVNKDSNSYSASVS